MEQQHHDRLRLREPFVTLLPLPARPFPAGLGLDDAATTPWPWAARRELHHQEPLRVRDHASLRQQRVHEDRQLRRASSTQRE